MKATASRAATSMSSRHEVSSRRIDHLRGLENRLPADIVSAAFDGSASDQIHVSSEYSAQLVLHPDNVEERAPSFRIETDQHIDIAIGSEIVPHHGAEQSQFRNSPALAEEVAIRSEGIVIREVMPMAPDWCLRRSQRRSTPARATFFPPVNLLGAGVD